MGQWLLFPGVDDYIVGRLARGKRLQEITRRGGTGTRCPHKDDIEEAVCFHVHDPDVANLADIEDMGVEPWPCEVPIPNFQI